MRGYKVFNPDWTCQGKQYAVGKIATQDGRLKMCGNGIHFCIELADCFRYYCANPKCKLAEVIGLGKVLYSDEDSKCCTDRLIVVRELSIAKLLKNKAFCLKVIKRNAYQVRFMEEQDQEVYLAAVKQNGDVLEYVPEAMKTPEICMAAVQKNGLALEYVPKAEKTPELCMEAVHNDGMAIQYIPEDLWTEKICLTAIQNDGRAIKYIPENLITPELCLAVVLSRNSYLLTTM